MNYDKIIEAAKEKFKDKKFCFTRTGAGSLQTLVICVENEDGYNPMPNISDLPSRMEAHIAELNFRLGLFDSQVAKIIGSTMRGAVMDQRRNR